MIDKDILKKRIIKRLREARKRNNLSQVQLSEMIGKNNKYIGQIESGIDNLPMDSLIDIANALNQPLEYFISDKETESLATKINRLETDKKETILKLVNYDR